MSENKKRALRRIEIAKETLVEADALIKVASVRGSVNRLYYVGFYAVTAYLFYLDITEATHKRVRIQFNKLLVRTNLVAEEPAKMFNKLTGIRNNSDYHDYSDISMEDVVIYRKSVVSIITSVEKLISD